MDRYETRSARKKEAVDKCVEFSVSYQQKGLCTDIFHFYYSCFLVTLIRAGFYP